MNVNLVGLFLSSHQSQYGNIYRQGCTNPIPTLIIQGNALDIHLAQVWPQLASNAQTDRCCFGKSKHQIGTRRDDVAPFELGHIG